MALRDGQWKVTGRVVRSLLGMTGTGKQQIAVTFEYDDDQAERRMVTWYGFFTDAALPWTVEALRALGWDPEQNNWDVLTLDDSDVLKGREASLVLEEEEYEGKRRTKVRFVNSMGGAGVERLEPGAAKAFAADLRKRLMSVAPPRAGAPKPQGPAQAPAARPPAPPVPKPADPAGNGEDLDLSSIPF